MKRSGNNILLVILMIVCQVMLAGLLVQWIRSQWKDEKESFVKDIDLKFTESVNQVMDSMLIKHLIVPVLNDTSAKKDHPVKYLKRSGDIDKAERHVTAFYNKKDGNKQTLVTITIPDSGKLRGRQDLDYSFFDSTEQKMLLRSIRLIIRETGDTTGRVNHFDHLIAAQPDTTLLRKLFENKLPARFKIGWIPDSIIHKAGPAIYLRTNLFYKPLGMSIQGFKGIIFKRISAQLFFALSLLMLTAAAFFFTYRSMKKQALLNTLRNDFISNISHELKTPVSTVSIALEALKNFDRKMDVARSDEYINIAVSETKRLDQLISQVLNTLLLEEADEYLNPEDTDLVALTREVMNSMQVRFNQAGAKVTFNSGDETIYLRLDKLHVYGVIMNLLDNSLKYSSVNPEIYIDITQKASAVLLTISDNGPGIPGEYITKVFDKFFRVPKGDVHNIKGYGLGLSYADLVMRHLGGSIKVRNKNEGGCEFTLLFPIQK